jgi:uncharacterized membrane protein YjjP (DUF1212 family)
MFSAYGARETHVYATTAHIVVTVETEEGELYTETCRPGSISNNFELLEKANRLVRRISRETPTVNEIRRAIDALPRKTYPIYIDAMAQGVISAAFCVFFGSRSVVEFLLAFLIAAAIACFAWGLDHIEPNRFLKSMLLSFLASTCAFGVARLGLVPRPDYIIIGCIMNLIPGLGFTGAFRDLFVGDLFTGMVRILGAVLLAASLAVGFILTMLMFGGTV